MLKKSFLLAIIALMFVASPLSAAIPAEANHIERLREEATKGDAEAQKILGWVYYGGEYVAQDYAEAVKWFRKAAEQGVASAQYFLGFMYYKGEGVAQDYAKAAKWYRKAAEQGVAVAQFNLGVMYSEGQGVVQDYTEATKWSRKAAEQGNASAQFNLGVMYGKGVSQDYAEAVKWFRKAAEQGDAKAQFNLGMMYYNGQGVAQDYAEAVKWLRKAAEQGDAKAQFNLGLKYGNGQGVAQDYAEAVKWLRKAAEQGVASAQYFLGLMYFEGEGIAENNIQAYKWTILAAAQGDNSAAENKDMMKNRLSSYEIAEAQSLASEFVPQKQENNDKVDIPKILGSIQSSGTAFFISTDGFLLTASHVVENAHTIKVFTHDGEREAKVISRDSVNDIAILKIDCSNASALILKPSSSVRIGAEVFTIGFPNVNLQGFYPKYTKGSISSLMGLQDDPRHFQISIPVQPGNSGGPLVDSDGKVVGIILARLSDKVAIESTGMIPQNVNYAIKSSFIMALIESIPQVLEGQKHIQQKHKKSEDPLDKALRASALIVCH